MMQALDVSGSVYFQCNKCAENLLDKYIALIIHFNQVQVIFSSIFRD